MPVKKQASRKAASSKSAPSGASVQTAKASTRRGTAKKDVKPAQPRQRQGTRKAAVARRPVARKVPVRAGAPEIMLSLNSEHRHIASLLDALAEQADRLLPGRTPDYGMMLDIARYMSEYPDEYHHPREDLLFAKLSERDPEALPDIAQLLEGHKEIYRRSRELLGELQRANREGEAVDNHRLKFLCDRYIGYYWDHINTEEGRVFPRATAKLRQDDWYFVNSQARFVDDPLFGARVRKEYQKLSLYLGERMTRATEDIAVAELFGMEALIEAVAAVGGAMGEIREVLRRRLRATARETFGPQDARAEIAPQAGQEADSSEIPLVAHAKGAAREIGEIVRRSRGELSEPFSARMQYLRRLLD